MLVSIIVPCYNAEDYIVQCIQSVISQTYQNWELIIIDDASSDFSSSAVASLQKHEPRIQLTCLDKNQGVANARNIGIARAQGPIIAFLDADDYWHPQKLELQIRLLLDENLDICYSSYIKISKALSSVVQVPTSVNYKKLLKHNVIACSSAIMRKKALSDIRFLKIGHEDYVFWLSLLKRGAVAGGLNSPLMYYRADNVSLSSNKVIAAGYTWNIYRKVEKLPLLVSVYFFSNYVIRALVKFLK